MAFLLDTHIFLYFINGDDSISKKTIALINNPLFEKFISVASIWEITVKINIGKLRLKDNLDSIYKILDEFNISILHPQKIHFKVNLDLPLIHKDPFDRLIISQTIADDLILITDDQHIKNYPNLKTFK